MRRSEEIRIGAADDLRGVGKSEPTRHAAADEDEPALQVLEVDVVERMLEESIEAQVAQFSVGMKLGHCRGEYTTAADSGACGAHRGAHPGKTGRLEDPQAHAGDRSDGDMPRTWPTCRRSSCQWGGWGFRRKLFHALDEVHAYASNPWRGRGPAGCLSLRQSGGPAPTCCVGRCATGSGWDGDILASLEDAQRFVEDAAGEDVAETCKIAAGALIGKARPAVEIARGQQDAVPRSVGSGADRISGAEQRNDRHAQRCGQVHRAGVHGDGQFAPV